MDGSHESRASYTYATLPDPNLLCPICHSVLSSPAWMSITCEHFYCRDCILQSLQTSQSCPCDRQPLSRDQLVPAPRLVQLMLDELVVKCDGDRCAWAGQRSHWKNHLCMGGADASGSAAFVCKWRGCKDLSISSEHELLEHQERSCGFRVSACEVCGEAVLSSEMEVSMTTNFYHLSFMCSNAPKLLMNLLVPSF